jgi:hypothetical protein
MKVRAAIVEAICFACCVAAVGVASPRSAAQSPELKINGKSIRLVGCIETIDAPARRLSLSDRKRGVSYLLSGADVSVYEGRRVRIVGGLLPSANIAAQAGAIDPTVASSAALDRRPAGPPMRIEELLVTRVMPLEGTCGR